MLNLREGDLPVEGTGLMDGVPTEAGQEDGQGARPATLDEFAYVAIQRMLVRLEIPPASPVDDADLARRLGIGRTPVRRALKRLALEGLVTIYPRRGTFATDISLESVSKLSELRVELEGLAAERAAVNAATASTETLRDLRRQVVTPHRSEEHLFSVYKRVHAEIYELANNPYLTRVALTHYQLSYRLWYAFQEKLEPLTDHVDFYTQLIDAILARDPSKARSLAAQHVLNFREEVRSSI